MKEEICEEGTSSSKSKTGSKTSGLKCSPSVETKSSNSTIGDENFWFSKLKTECFKAFPTYFLKSNAIVDLIFEPGKIMKKNSLEADDYCGKFLFDCS